MNRYIDKDVEQEVVIKFVEGERPFFGAIATGITDANFQIGLAMQRAQDGLQTLAAAGDEIQPDQAATVNGLMETFLEEIGALADKKHAVGLRLENGRLKKMVAKLKAEGIKK